MKTSHYTFSKHSREQLESVHFQLAQVFHVTLAFGIIDFKVLEGARTDKKQWEYFNAGTSTVKPGPNAKHTVGPASGRTKGHAVDALPLDPVDWDDRERFALLAGLVFAAAKIVGIEIRWGGDWDGDGETKDEKFRDSGHFEIVT